VSELVFPSGILICDVFFIPFKKDIEIQAVLFFTHFNRTAVKRDINRRYIYEK
jgi:hypothetical protein